MATIRHDIAIDAPAAQVWEAVGDVHAPHRRLVPHVLSDARADGDARIVTFANGLVVRERIVTVDDEARRFAYTASGGRTTHHHASMQVLDDGPQRARLVWIIDVLPDEVAPVIDALMRQGADDMRATLARAAR